MNKMKLHIGLTVLGCAFLMISFGQAAAAETKEIHFGYLVADQVHEPAPMIMKELKLLEKRGLKVKWGEFLAGAYLCQHMASGEVDFGTGGAVPVIITRGTGVDLVTLAGSNTEGSCIVVKDSIKTIKDLDGASLGTPGIGSIQDAMVDMVAQKNNIKVLHKNMKVSDMPIFLKKGEIDGFIAWEPNPARAVDLGYGHILTTSKEILPGHQCCVLVARGALLKQDPETVRKVISAYVEAMEWFNNNKDESVQMIARVTGMEDRVVRAALTTVAHPFPPYTDKASMKLMADGLLKSGKLQKELVPDLDKFISELDHPEFLKEHMSARK